MTAPVAWAVSTPIGALNNSYLNLCVIDADAYECRFPLILRALHAQQAQIPGSENVLFLVNYSMASQEVRDTIMSLFTDSMHTGALADLRLVKHKEAVHRCDELSHMRVRKTDDDRGLGTVRHSIEDRALEPSVYSSAFTLPSSFKVYTLERFTAFCRSS